MVVGGDRFSVWMEADDAEFMRRLGRRIQTLRERQGLTQEDLDCDGLTVRTVQAVEAGSAQARVLTLRRIAARLKMSVAELVDVDCGVRRWRRTKQQL
jgi:transcriptional regulator with XRE-family HTH domain